MLFSRLAVLLCVASCLFPQQRVDPRNMYERVIAVVPMIGEGTYGDPKRPMYVPADGVSATREGIISFSYQVSDDGNSAIVEFVAASKEALQPILKDAKLAGKVFEKGKAKKADVEKELKKYKKDVKIDDYLPAVAQ